MVTLHRLITMVGAIATIVMMIKFTSFSNKALEQVDTIIDQNNTLIHKRYEK